jgi:hypothetical protein
VRETDSGAAETPGDVASDVDADEVGGDAEAPRIAESGEEVADLLTTLRRRLHTSLLRNIQMGINLARSVLHCLTP